MNDCVTKIQDNDEIMFPNALPARGWTSPHRIKPYMRPTAPISLLNCLWDADLEVRPYSKKNFKMSLRWSSVNIGNYIMFLKILLLLFATECSIFGECVILQYIFHRVGLLSLLVNRLLAAFLNNIALFRFHSNSECQERNRITLSKLYINLLKCIL